MKQEFICIVCPRGCLIRKNDNKIEGYSCKRGLEYVLQESTKPSRVLTSTIRIKGKDFLCPIRTDGQIPKEKLFNAMKIIDSVEVELPIKYHQVLIENILDTGVNIISTKEIINE